MNTVGSTHGPSYFDLLPDPVKTHIFSFIIEDVERSDSSSYMLICKKLKSIFDEARCQRNVEAYLSLKHFQRRFSGTYGERAIQIKRYLNEDIDASKQDKYIHALVRSILTGKANIHELQDLLRAGADTNVKNKNGHTALTIAFLYMDMAKMEVIESVVSLLLKFGANPNGTEKHTPLLMLMSSKAGCQEYADLQIFLAKLLYKKGANPKKVGYIDSMTKTTPFNFAEQQHPFLVKVFTSS